MSVFPSIRIEGGLLSPDVPEQLLTSDLPGQKPVDFGLEARRNLTNEIAAVFADARAMWSVFRHRRQRLPKGDLGTSLTRDAWMVPFFGLLDYELRYNPRAHEVDGLTFAVSHRAGEAEDAPPVHIVGVRQDLGRLAPTGRPRLAPHSLTQEFLNRTEHLWGLVTNGLSLRLLRDSTFVRRQAYVEFDLEGVFEEERFQDFVVLYRLLHRSRLPRSMADAHECLLERYYQHSREQGGRVREHLRDGVKECLQGLGSGFLGHLNNERLRHLTSAAYADGDRLSPEGLYRELLRIVYRFLFLLVSEDRGLISSNTLYREHYGVARLRRLVNRREAYTENDDLWQSLCVLWKLLQDDSVWPQLENKPLASLLGLSVLDGELFEPLRLDKCTISNRDILGSFWHLAYYQDSPSAPPRRVNYAALDVEELGSVYESLLELQPVIEEHGHGIPGFSFAEGEERRTTGSYYTPPELVAELMRSALEPVIADRLKLAGTKEETETALLSIRVCDPACGSGHFLLAAARRLGKELARARANEDEPAPERVREAVRDVVAHCIYGVDKNPLAVELCRVALWLESHAEGKPLTFLDHRIRCGDSLVGVLDLSLLRAGIPDEAFEPVEGDEKALTRSLKRQNKYERAGRLASLFDARTEMSHAITAFKPLLATPDDSPAEIRAKQRAFHEWHARSTRERTACNLWTSAFFQSLSGENEAPITTNVLRTYLEARTAHGQALGVAEALALRHRFFHWPLEFPDVFTEDGFDVVLSNPPWGQKSIDADAKSRRFILWALPSSRGIFDFFRPFLELASRLTRANGHTGIVLPDILLLKNYEESRIFILQQLTILTIGWWRQPFPDAIIDAITIAMRRSTACADDLVSARIHDKGAARTATIPQTEFEQNERHTFNLFLTPEKRLVLDRLRPLPRLEEFFEVHEGVHSGNVRHELFVSSQVDLTTRPLVLAGSEVVPYSIHWSGRYIRLGIAPEKRTRERYANLGRSEWYEAVKVLVRRTGDRIIAAVDSEGRYASNNLFLILSKEGCSLDLWGLTALLNCRFTTWYFRAIEPREGRVFAEVKIKHISCFPLPEAVLAPNGCVILNELGAARTALERGAGASCPANDDRDTRVKRDALDQQIEREVLSLLQLHELGEPFTRPEV